MHHWTNESEFCTNSLKCRIREANTALKGCFCRIRSTQLELFYPQNGHFSTAFQLFCTAAAAAERPLPISCAHMRPTRAPAQSYVKKEQRAVLHTSGLVDFVDWNVRLATPDSLPEGRRED